MGEYYNSKSLLSGVSAPQMDVDVILKSGATIQQALNSVRQNELADEERAQKKILFDQQQDEYTRKLNERKATDLFNEEMLKGKQIRGGILNTDKLIAEANKYAFTPEELVKYDTYKGDEAAARKAGDTALADKMAWQTGMSDFASSGNDKLNESRVQMLERALGKATSQGLPVPAELIAGIDKARLEEATAAAEARKAIDEQILKKQEALDKDQKWAIGSLGASQDTDEYGVTYNRGGGSNASAIKAANTSVGQGDKIKMKAIEDMRLHKDSIPDAIAKFTEVTNILTARGIPYDDASAIVANGMYGKEQNPVLSWIGLGKTGPALNQEAIDLYADNAVKQYKQANIGNSSSTGPSDKAIAAVNYFNKQADNTQRSLAELHKKKALLEGTPEDRQVAALDRALQSKGLLEAPLSEQLVSKTKNATTTKNLNAPNPNAVVKPTINRNIKSIAGIPDSLVAAENIVNKAYSLPGEGFTVGMGYNIDKNIETLDTDFKHADIPVWKAELAKTNPENLVLTDGEATRLAQVAYYNRIERLEKATGTSFDKLSPEMQGTAMQMMYRGDLGNTPHGKVFKKLIAADDYEGLTGYITANAKNLPAPIVTRFNLDLGMPNKEKLRGDSFMKSNDEKNAYLKKALESQGKNVGGDYSSNETGKVNTSTADGISSQLKDIPTSELSTLIVETSNDSAFKDVNADYKEEMARRAKDSFITIDGKPFDISKALNSGDKSMLKKFDDFIKKTVYNKDGSINNAGTAKIITVMAAAGIAPSVVRAFFARGQLSRAELQSLIKGLEGKGPGRHPEIQNMLTRFNTKRVDPLSEVLRKEVPINVLNKVPNKSTLTDILNKYNTPRVLNIK